MATQVTLGSGVVDSASGLKLRTNGSTEAVDISTGQVATLAQNPILTSGTANGVAYLNGSKVVTTGSALTFDGTNLSVGSGSGSPVLKISGANTSGAGPYLQFLRGGSQTNIIGPYSIVASGTSNDLTYYTTTGYGHVWFSNGQASTINMQLDASGNLGLGATPSAWDSSILTAFQVRSGSVSSVPSGLNDMYVTSNAYYNGGWKYINTATATQYRQSNGHQWLLAASGTAGNAITFTQAMTLDASGNLLVGTSSAVGSSLLQVSGAASVLNGNNLYFWNSGNTTAPYIANPANALAFYTNTGSEAARIDSSGNFLVGRTSTGSGIGVELQPSGIYQSVLSASTSATTTLQVYSSGGGAYRFYVDMGGTVHATSTSITAISDQRLKENVRDLDTGLSTIMALKPRRFDWKEGKGLDKKNAAGFIAQEFEEVFPASVGTTLAGADGIEYKNINYEELIPTLTKALQELKAEFDAYKATHP